MIYYLFMLTATQMTQRDFTVLCHQVSIKAAMTSFEEYAGAILRNLWQQNIPSAAAYRLLVEAVDLYDQDVQTARDLHFDDMQSLNMMEEVNSDDRR